MKDQRQEAVARKIGEMRRDSEERSAERMAQGSGYTYVDVRKLPPSLEATKLIPEETARAASVAALELRVKNVALGVLDPAGPGVADISKKLTDQGYAVALFICSQSGLEQAWLLYKNLPVETEEITGKVTIGKERIEGLLGRLVTVDAARKEIEAAAANKLTTMLLFEAVLTAALANRASDIHLEAEEKEAAVRFRIDGALHDISRHLPLHNYQALVSRIKLLSGLKINVRTEAQDGRFTIGVVKKEIEVRVSIIPSEFGETIVMRILDPDSIAIGLDALGLRPDDLLIVERQLAKPNGLLLNTGPTGSGKTTTLYAFLRQVNKPDIKIITIEDPVEYHLPGIEQTQVNPKAGYTFANGLRSILRQDPDVLLIGEIRDAETADIALQAALTGHIVFSTLHTNDAVGAVPRLIDLGVKPITIGPAVSLIIAQRLVRKLCVTCRKPAAATGEIAQEIKKFLAALPARVERGPYTTPKLHEAVGCTACNGTGYRGRVGVFEFFEAGSDFERVVLETPSESALRELSKKQAMVTMQQDGILKSLVGVTTLVEVESITGPLTW